MVPMQEDRPLVLRPAHHVQLPIESLGGAGPSEAKGPSVARIVQRMQRRGIQQRRKMHLASVRASVDTTWKEEALLTKVFDGGTSGAGALEGGKEQPQRLLY